MPLEHLPIDNVTPFFDVNPAAPPDAAMEALIASIRARGVLKPILVRLMNCESGERNGKSGEPCYGIMQGMGARRFEASRLAGLKRIPAFVLPRDDAEEDPHAERSALLQAAVAVVSEEDADVAEEELACPFVPGSLAWARDARLLLQTGSYEEACATLGVTEADLDDALELLTLPASVLRLLEDDGDDASAKAFTPDYARVLLRELPGETALQAQLAEKAQADVIPLAAFTRLVSNVADAVADGDDAAIDVLLEQRRKRDVTQAISSTSNEAAPRTAQGWAARIASDSAALGLLLDEGIAGYLAPAELDLLTAAAADAARRMELFVHKLRRASEKNDVAKLDGAVTLPPTAARLACPLCGHAEREAATHCTVCWTPLRRCVDCAHYAPAKGVCDAYGVAVARADAENPETAAPSFCCGNYAPAFTPRLLAESLRVVE